MNAKPQLGDQVSDLVTKFTGIVVGKTIWLNGCVRYAVQGPLKDGEVKDPIWIDAQQCVVKKRGVVPAVPEEGVAVQPVEEKKEVVRTGGPTPTPKKHPVPHR